VAAEAMVSTGSDVHPRPVHLSASMC